MDKSPFGKLSPELRNRIYDLTLVYQDMIRIDLSWKCSMYSHGTWGTDVPQTNALLQTCQQMRAESAVLYYASNDFGILIRYSGSSAPKWMPPLVEKLHSLGSYILSHMKSFELGQGSGKRIILLTPTKKLRTMNVKYDGYRIDENPYHARLFDPIINVYEKLGFILSEEEQYFDQNVRNNLKSLRRMDAQVLRNKFVTTGLRLENCGRENIWLGKANLKRPDGYDEVTIESLGFRWKPWLKILAEKGLKFEKGAECDESMDEKSGSDGYKLLLMRNRMASYY